MRYLIGLDLGTTTVKATVYREDGTPVSNASMERILLTPKEGYYEQDANTWYEDSCTVIKEATKDIDKNEVAGLSISSQGITTVPVDECFDPLNNAINWMDVRPVASWNSFVDKVGIEYLRKTTGYPVKYDVPKCVAKMMWVKEILPEIYKKTKYFLMPASFVTAKLTGNVLTDPTMASGSLLYSNLQKKYDKKIIDASGIGENMLAPVVPMGTFAGNLTEKAAEDSGLTVNCVVAVGGQDQKVAAFGLDVNKGQIACSMGTSAAFEFAIDGCGTDNAPDDFKVCPYVDNTFVLEGVIKTGGGAIRWLRDTICVGEDYAQMDKEANEAPIGSHGAVFIPYLGGSPDNNGFASFRNIGLHVSRADMIRAVYEGIAFEAARVIKSADVFAKELRIYSGGSKNRLLCQIIADVTAIPVIAFDHSEMGSLGAAKLAASCVGIDGNSFSEKCLSESHKYIPQNTKEYLHVFEKYLDYLKG